MATYMTDVTVCEEVRMVGSTEVAREEDARHEAI